MHFPAKLPFSLPEENFEQRVVSFFRKAQSPNQHSSTDHDVLVELADVPGANMHVAQTSRTRLVAPADMQNVILRVRQSHRPW